jgi:poly(3-hydroxyalkanoate) depolymerase
MSWSDSLQFVEAGGVRLRVQVRGSGPPLLLIMGIGAPLEMWSPLLEHLPGRTSIVFDAPGTGESAQPRLPLRMRDVAAITDGMVDQLGYDQVDVIGVSFGGFLAQQLAYQAPARVRRLILAATAPGFGAIPGNPLALLALMTPLRYYSPAFLRLIAPHIYGGKQTQDAKARAIVVELYSRRPPSLRGYLGQLWSVTGWTSLPFLHRIGQPTMIVAGDDDPLAPLINARFMAWRMPDARLEVIKGGGHLFVIERAPQLAMLVEGFLSESASAHGSWVA